MVTVKDPTHRIAHAIHSSLDELLPTETLTNETLILAPNNPDNFLRDLLADNHGVALLDVHSEGMSFAYSAQNMEQLASSGVKSIYIELSPSDEALQTKDGSNLIDAYLNSQNNSVQEKIFGERLTTYLTEQTRLDTPQPFMDMLNESKKNNIDIILIDIDTARDISLHMGGRIEETNYVWSRNVLEHQQELQPDDKYIIIGGGYHFKPAKFSNQEGVVDDVLKIPSINFVAGEEVKVDISTSPNQDYTITMPLPVNERTIEPQKFR